MHLKTNGHARELLYLEELPNDAREQFDYVQGDDAYSPRFFRYRGAWYDTGDCERSTLIDGELSRFSGYFSETFFSAVAFTYTDDFEYVKVTYVYE